VFLIRHSLCFKNEAAARRGQIPERAGLLSASIAACI
jgi:hypothetical protein